MTSSTAERLRELLEEMDEQSKISDRIREDAKRQYEEAEKRKQATYARIRAEQLRAEQSFLSRLRKSILGR